MGRRVAKPIELACQLIETPLGALTVVESERGVMRVDFGRTALKRLQDELRAKLVAAEIAGLRSVTVDDLASAKQLREYAAGSRRRFDVAIDWALVPGFKRAVLERLCQVPFGQLVSYGELARLVGKPGAARAVGGAMRTNPIPIIVPCHRVIAADGSLGGFSGGLETKRRLHAHERIARLPGGWRTAAENRAR